MPTPMVLDMSHYQTVTSWADIRAAGIAGIIYKCTEGSSYADTTYPSRRVAAREAGLLWGAYHFLRPGNMAQQAKFFVDQASIDEDTLLAADHEDTSVSLSDLKNFLDEVQQLSGRGAVIYSGHVLKEQLGKTRDPFLAQHRLWLAHYTNGVPTWPTETWPMWWLWQYTDTGKCAGITGNVDLNACSVSAELLAMQWPGIVVTEEKPAAKGVAIAIETSADVELSLFVNGNAITIGQET